MNEKCHATIHRGKCPFTLKELIFGLPISGQSPRIDVSVDADLTVPCPSTLCRNNRSAFLFGPTPIVVFGGLPRTFAGSHARYVCELPSDHLPILSRNERRWSASLKAAGGPDSAHVYSSTAKRPMPWRRVGPTMLELESRTNACHYVLQVRLAPRPPRSALMELADKAPTSEPPKRPNDSGCFLF